MREHEVAIGSVASLRNTFSCPQRRLLQILPMESTALNTARRCESSPDPVLTVFRLL